MATVAASTASPTVPREAMEHHLPGIHWGFFQYSKYVPHRHRGRG